MPDFVKEGVVSEEEMDAHYAATLEKIEKLEMRNMLRRDEDKLGPFSTSTPGGRHGGARLGVDAHAHVYPLGRGPRL